MRDIKCKNKIYGEAYTEAFTLSLLIIIEILILVTLNRVKKTQR